VVGAHYADLAEAVLAALWPVVVADFAAKHGPPPGRGAALIGMGSLGARTTSATSDLDLIVIYDAAGIESSDGRRPLASRAYYAKLTQAMVTALSAPMAEGKLYEVDMRLRPSGRQGMLVSSLEAFEDYQREAAWVWERQALIRARPVAGDAGLGERFNQIRNAVLASVSALENLRDEVRDMRERMRRELGSRGQAGFHLKQDRGGIVDIEFMVQFLTLRWCRDHPQLLSHTATIHLLKALAKQGLLKSAYAQTLIEAYRQFRALGHSLTLAEASSLVDEEMVRSERRKVAGIWTQLMEK